MRIGVTGGGSSVDRMVEQAKQAEADGFTSVWYASAIGGDPLVAMAFAGRATSSIELGTAVLQTYTCHPLLQANRAAATVGAMGRPGLTLGVGPSHGTVIEGVYGMSYDHPGRHTEEYVRILTGLLRGDPVDVVGDDWTLRGADRMVATTQPVPVMVAALSSRLLRIAGGVADGTVLWMAPARAIAEHVVPRITAAASGAGRSAPRVVAGLPVAVHDDVAEARSVAASLFAGYGTLPNYRRILDLGGAAGPAEAAIVGDETSVAGQLQALVDAGATDVWAAVFPVGDDRSGSRRRTTDLLRELVS